MPHWIRTSTYYLLPWKTGTTTGDFLLLHWWCKILDHLNSNLSISKKQMFFQFFIVLAWASFFFLVVEAPAAEHNGSNKKWELNLFKMQCIASPRFSWIQSALRQRNKIQFFICESEMDCYLFWISQGLFIESWPLYYTNKISATD